MIWRVGQAWAWRRSTASREGVRLTPVLSPRSVRHLRRRGCSSSRRRVCRSGSGSPLPQPGRLNLGNGATCPLGARFGPLRLCCLAVLSMGGLSGFMLRNPGLPRRDPPLSGLQGGAFRKPWPSASHHGKNRPEWPRGGEGALFSASADRNWRQCPPAPPPRSTADQREGRLTTPYRHISGGGVLSM